MTKYRPGMSLDDPLTLTQALTAEADVTTRPVPGDTIWLADGTYTGDFVASIVGDANNPIIFRPMHPGKAIIDGSMFLETASNIIFHDIEFTFTGWLSRQGANDYGDGRVLEGTGARVNSPMLIHGNDITLINCILHDGFNFAAFGSGLHMYGCLVYNNGVKQLNGGGNGHGLYAHSLNQTRPAVFDNCIWMANYNYTLHVNSDSVSEYSHYHFQNNIIGKTNGKNIISCGNGPARDIKFLNNCTWSTYIWANRWSAATGEDLEFSDNYMVGSNEVWNGAAGIKVFQTITARRNTWVAHRVPEILSVKYPATGEVDYNFADNDYYTTGTGLAFNPYNRAEFDGLYHTFADWQTLTGLDATSREHRDITPPDYVKLYPNSYDTNKANLAVYNWSLAEAVTVDVSSVYQPDQIIRARNAADYYSDYTDLTVDPTGHITLPMTGHTVAVPLMDTAALDGTSFPTFGAFMLEAL